MSCEKNNNLFAAWQTEIVIHYDSKIIMFLYLRFLCPIYFPNIFFVVVLLGIKPVSDA
jgi:hypothetical protein